MTATDTQPVTTALTRLYTEAQARGWQPDGGRHPRPGCWHDENGTSEFTVSTADDVQITIVNAHTPDDSLKLTAGRADHEDRAIDQLRRFLGWPEEDAP